MSLSATVLSPTAIDPRDGSRSLAHAVADALRSCLAVTGVRVSGLTEGIMCSCPHQQGDSGPDDEDVRKSQSGVLIGMIAQTAPLHSFDDEDDRQRGVCPWHLDPAASLYATETTWHGVACHASGDAVDWIMPRDMGDRMRAGERLHAYLSPAP